MKLTSQDARTVSGSLIRISHGAGQAIQEMTIRSLQRYFNSNTRPLGAEHKRRLHVTTSFNPYNHMAKKEEMTAGSLVQEITGLFAKFTGTGELDTNIDALVSETEVAGEALNFNGSNETPQKSNDLKRLMLLLEASFRFLKQEKPSFKINPERAGAIAAGMDGLITASEMTVNNMLRIFGEFRSSDELITVEGQARKVSEIASLAASGLVLDVAEENRDLPIAEIPFANAKARDDFSRVMGLAVSFIRAIPSVQAVQSGEADEAEFVSNRELVTLAEDFVTGSIYLEADSLTLNCIMLGISANIAANGFEDHDKKMKFLNAKFMAPEGNKTNLAAYARSLEQARPKCLSGKRGLKVLGREFAESFRNEAQLNEAIGYIRKAVYVSKAIDNTARELLA